VEDLTRIACIAKGTLYLYFRDKEDLIQAVVTAGFELLQQRVRERTDGARTASDVVSRIVAAHLEFFVDGSSTKRGAC
jgi:AcrR family transcriptional regulator